MPHHISSAAVAFGFCDFSNIGISGAQVSAARCGLALSPKAAALNRVVDPNFRINFRALREFVFGQHPRQNDRAICVGSTRAGGDQAIWYMARKAGWLTETPERSFSGREKVVDTTLSVKMVEEVLMSGLVPQEVDVTLLSGDRDLLPAVQCLTRRGYRVTVCGWAHSTAEELRLAADQFVALDDYFTLLRLH